MTEPKKRNAQAATRKILDAAKQLLAEGDGHVEMAWVARAAGVSQGLAYHHFGSKEGLLSAVINDFYNRIEDAALMARLEELPTWERREAERVRRYIEFLVSDPLASIVITRLAGTPAVAEVEAQRWEALVTTGARNMSEGQMLGQVRSDQPAELLAAMTLGAVRAAVNREFSNQTTPDPETLATDIWRFVWQGLRAENNHE